MLGAPSKQLETKKLPAYEAHAGVCIWDEHTAPPTMRESCASWSGHPKTQGSNGFSGGGTCKFESEEALGA